MSEQSVGQTLSQKERFKQWLETPLQRAWRDEFSERELDEIRLCEHYARNFAHGTVGHNEKMIIAKMAQLLDTYTDVESD